MKKSGHLWAIGYDNMERAQEVRTEITKLGESHCLILLDTAVVVRYPDGSVTRDGEPFAAPPKLGGHGLAGLLAGLALGAPPLTGAAVGPYLGCIGAAPGGIGIDAEFVGEVEAMIKPGTSALFVLDQEGDMGAILQGIRGLGGTVLRTNVDMERARLIESTLAGAAPAGPQGGSEFGP
jgi:uncharacterized membrane protein